MTPDETETQETEKGVEIPVPTRREFFGNLAKVAPPAESAEPASESAEREGSEGG